MTATTTAAAATAPAGTASSASKRSRFNRFGAMCGLCRERKPSNAATGLVEPVPAAASESPSSSSLLYPPVQISAASKCPEQLQQQRRHSSSSSSSCSMLACGGDGTPVESPVTDSENQLAPRSIAVLPSHGAPPETPQAMAPSPVVSTPEKPRRLLIRTLRRWKREEVKRPERSAVNSPTATAAASPSNALAGLVTQVEQQQQRETAAAAAAAVVSTNGNKNNPAAALATQVQPNAAPPTPISSPSSSLPGVVITELNCGPYLGAPLAQHAGKPTLVLDLDETLVHSSFVEVPSYHFVIPVNIEGTVHAIYVAKRPGVDAFLQHVAQWYEVVIFTASLEKYAAPLMDRLDPERHCAYRLFRERCVLWNGQYVKDLTRLGRELSKVCIIDNSPNSYAFQPENAVPIGSWFDDTADTELTDLLPLLRELSKVPSIPDAITTTLK